MPRSNEGSDHKKNGVLMPDVEGLQCKRGLGGWGGHTAGLHSEGSHFSHRVTKYPALCFTVFAP